MPGFDGTGPAGLGPMTGRANGYCVLKKSGTEDRPLIGFAGLSGRPILSRPPCPSSGRQDIRMRLDGLRWRIRRLNLSVFIENQGET